MGVINVVFSHILRRLDTTGSKLPHECYIFIIVADSVIIVIVVVVILTVRGLTHKYIKVYSLRG